MRLNGREGPSHTHTPGWAGAMNPVCVIALPLAISKSNVFLTLDDQGDPDGLCALTNEAARCVRVLSFVVPPVWRIWALLGTTSPLSPCSAIHS